MQGIIQPKMQSVADRGYTEKFRDVFEIYKYFILVVLLPTALTALYYYGFASDQYESRTDFVIRRADSSSTSNGFGQLLGMSFGATATTEEAQLVADYLLSHDAVARLRKQDNLVARFQRPGIDIFSRLWFDNPTPERVLKYYKNHVTIEQDADTGITALKVHAFSPQDSYDLAHRLLLMGEERINALNERTYHDQVEHARVELEKAEVALAQSELALTNFRKSSADIDPEGTGKAQIGLVSGLTAAVAVQRAKVEAMRGVISRNSPQFQAAEQQLRALEAQISGQSARIVGPGKSTASHLGDYENLVIRRESAARRYATVSGEYQQAKAEASRKQVYLVRVVEPNMAVKSLYPERGRIVITVFLALVLSYGIGWMLLAGIREHSL